MASKIINVLLTSFAGLDLPPTLAVQISSSTPIYNLTDEIFERLPQIDSRLILTTSSNKEVLWSSSQSVSSLLSCSSDTILPLRLSVPLCGGKGGFGSQLRAAGGRMSSRKKKNQGENNGSNRNLDGRRLRTVTEAKALAEYLALKSNVDKQEKATRRTGWERVIELAERREEEIQNVSRGRVDGKWVEDKEEAGERTREAVFAAMNSRDYTDALMRDAEVICTGSRENLSQISSSQALDDSSADATTPPSAKEPRTETTRAFFGFDDDEYESSDEDDEQNDGTESRTVATPLMEEAKGKRCS